MSSLLSLRGFVTIVTRANIVNIDMFLMDQNAVVWVGLPMAERSKSLDFGSELEITHVQILSVTIALFINIIDLVLYRLSPLFCLIRSSHRPVVHEGGQNKA
ncbi:hypothetical protein J6590_042640 [Homalodisca vitripennis]|nr:hypothetical protein J6590_042640 [Homalodisca vitripennis]